MHLSLAKYLTKSSQLSLIIQPLYNLSSLHKNKSFVSFIKISSAPERRKVLYNIRLGSQAHNLLSGLSRPINLLAGGSNRPISSRNERSTAWEDSGPRAATNAPRAKVLKLRQMSAAAAPSQSRDGNQPEREKQSADYRERKFHSSASL